MISALSRKKSAVKTPPSDQSPLAVIGLGNPGARYSKTRHNAGFWVLDRFQQYLAEADPRRGSTTPWEEARGKSPKCALAKGKLGETELLLLKPLGFMNLSGQAVAPILRFYKLALSQVVVVYDELDLDPGVLRLKRGGSSGGHRGVQDLCEALGGADFFRLRVGIGHPRRAGAGGQAGQGGLERVEQDVSQWVLSAPPSGSEEQVLLQKTVERAVEALVVLLEVGLEAAQLQFHPRAV